MKKMILSLLVFFSLATPSSIFLHAQELDNEMINAMPQTASEIQTDYFRGKVTKVIDEGVTEIGTFKQPYQQVEVEILNGSDKGKTFEHEFQFAESNGERQKLHEGDKVVVVKVLREEPEYYIAEHYRLPAILFFFFLFFFLSVVFAGKKGFTALIGLAFSLLVIMKLILPMIVAGKSPVLASVFGSFLILSVALYLAHGFNRRTTVALAGTTITLVVAVLLSAFAVRIADMFGMGSEEAISLLQGKFRDINLQGLYLGGIIIGALGVLDDVTTTQTATVAELKRANPSLGVKELYKRGLVVGKEHIASLINTLALAYVGASLPLLLIFTQLDFPLWVNMNSEFVMEEFIRTIIGSSALILAVPITTYLAARFFMNHTFSDDETEAHHHHMH